MFDSVSVGFWSLISFCQSITHGLNCPICHCADTCPPFPSCFPYFTSFSYPMALSLFYSCSSLCFALVRITMFCHLQDCNVLPSSGLKYFAIVRIGMSCHNQDYSVLPSSSLQCFVIVWNTMFCLIQVCNIWPSSVFPSSGIGKFDF